MYHEHVGATYIEQTDRDLLYIYVYTDFSSALTVTDRLAVWTPEIKTTISVTLLDLAKFRNSLTRPTRCRTGTKRSETTDLTTHATAL
jgi:phage-related baseplate assembly protein